MGRYVGIDLGISTKHKATVYDGLEKVSRTFSIDTSHDGLEYLLKRATEGVEGPVNFVFEPTSVVWLPIAAYCSAAGHRTYMVKTQKSSDFRKFFSKYAKSDSIDSGVLARIPQIDPQRGLPPATQRSNEASLQTDEISMGGFKSAFY